jgi:hypothetical protein
MGLGEMTNALGLGSEFEGERLGDVMMNGGNFSGNIVVDGTPQQVAKHSGHRGSNGTGRRRFFQSSGIRLRGVKDVHFPPSVLNVPSTDSWGPAGFEGFGNEAHVMKRGFGFSYGYGGYTGGVAANGDTNADADADDNGAAAGSGRRGRYPRRGEEEMEVDVADSD